MRILQISNLYPPYAIGGYERMAEQVADALRQRGHEVFTLTGRGKRFDGNGRVFGELDLDLDQMERTVLGHATDLRTVFQRHVFNARNLLATWRCIRRLRPDLVTAWNLYLLSVTPLIAARWAGVPTAVHLTDRWLLYYTRNLRLFIDLPGRKKRRALEATRRFVQPLLHRCVPLRHLIVPSRALRQVYLDHGYPPEAFVLQPHAIPTRAFPYRERARQGPLRLLYLGQLWEGKGPQVLLRALGQLARAGWMNFRLDVYGQGTADFVGRYLPEVAAQEGVTDLWSFRGTVPPQELPAVYAAHDILVFPSIWLEPFALVPLQAMSTGMAIVATTAGGTPEAIEDGRTGLLVPPDDSSALANAIRRLGEDPALARRLGENASHAARERYDFDAFVNNTSALYERVVRGRDAEPAGESVEPQAPDPRCPAA